MIAKGSLPWILIPVIVALISVFLSFLVITLIFLLITISFLIFFRDPERSVGFGIVAPADGKITDIDCKSNFFVVSILMALHNVHVNRAPLAGKVINIKHFSGKHVPAFDKNSEFNERVEITLITRIGKVKVVQIAGAFARRIQPYVRKGNTISKGQRIGIIRFGSRVDLYLPKNKTKVLARIGVKVKAGESCLAVEAQDEN
jgi:phosphatidylserine decarboxylase